MFTYLLPNRAFSHMNIIMNDLRSTLLIDHVSDLMFIHLHGPPVSQWKPLSYVKSWVTKHRHATDSRTRLAVSVTETELEHPDLLWDILWLYDSRQYCVDFIHNLFLFLCGLAEYCIVLPTIEDCRVKHLDSSSRFAGHIRITYGQTTNRPHYSHRLLLRFLIWFVCI